MSYIINHYEGQQLVQVSDATIDDSTCDLKLIGRNYAGYGEAQNENFVFLLENFAGKNQPNRPLTGQLWYDTTTNKIKFYDGNMFMSTARMEVCNIAPTYSPKILGDLWFNSADSQLFAWNGSNWTLVGPDLTSSTGTTKMRVRIVKDTSDADHVIIEAVVNDDVVFVISSDTFILSSSTPITGFSKIYEGTTLVNTPDTGITNSSHRYWGTASNAEKLSGKTKDDFHPMLGESSLAFSAKYLSLASDPSIGLNGNIRYVNGKFQGYHNGWIDFGADEGMIWPNAAGIPIYTGNQSWGSSLSPIGQAGKYLKSTGNYVEWASVDVGGNGTVTRVGLDLSNIGFTVSPPSITTDGTFGVTGKLGTAYGGTGRSDVGDNGQVLMAQNGEIVWGTVSSDGGGSGTVTQVAVTSSVGLTISGSPITTMGTISISGGKLGTAYGGTGRSDVGANGQVLMAQNGAIVWGTVSSDGGGGIPNYPDAGIVRSLGASGWDNSIEVPNDSYKRFFTYNQAGNLVWGRDIPALGIGTGGYGTDEDFMPISVKDGNLKLSSIEGNAYKPHIQLICQDNANTLSAGRITFIRNRGNCVNDWDPGNPETAGNYKGPYVLNSVGTVLGSMVFAGHIGAEKDDTYYKTATGGYINCIYQGNITTSTTDPWNGGLMRANMNIAATNAVHIRINDTSDARNNYPIHLRYVFSHSALYAHTGAEGIGSPATLGNSTYAWGSIYLSNIKADEGTATLSSTPSGQIIANTSDIKFKQNIENLNYGLAEVLQLNPITFEWKPESDRGTGRRIGFIAQETEQVIPEVVGHITTHDDEFKTLSYSDLVPVLTKAIQEQQAIIENLKLEYNSIIAELRQEINALKS